MAKYALLSISKVTAGQGADYVRLTIRRDGDKPAQRMLLAASFEGFSRALMGEAEVVVSIEKDIG